MNSALLGVGSNINPEENVLRAEQEVALLGRLIKKSGFIYTKPLGYVKQNDFLNGVFYIETPYEYKKLNDKLKKIENKLGRLKTENKFGPRTIDLDTVIFNNQVKDFDVFERYFIKDPVIEIMPEFKYILNCSSYQNHFYTVNEIIERIFSLLPSPPVSIFGAGQWFCEGESPAGDIEIFVVIDNAVNKYEEIVNQELKRSDLNIIESCPVRVRLFQMAEPEGKPAGKSIYNLSLRNIDLFISNSQPGILLYGEPLPVLSTLLQS